MQQAYVGQRLSLRRERCTVRYVGTVDGKHGAWLGVEWDDPSRGKHDGTVGGKTYFTCRSTASTCASFIRPDSRFDEIHTLHEAIRLKYGADDIIDVNSVQISGKVIEETGYDKISRRQHRFDELTRIILDEQSIKTCETSSETCLHILCPAATALDIGRNFFETLADVERVIDGSISLRMLSLEGNRLSNFDFQISFPGIKELKLDEMLLEPDELTAVGKAFPGLQQLSASSNRLNTGSACALPGSLQSLDLANNGFYGWDQVRHLLATCEGLESLNLKHNEITSLSIPDNMAATPFKLTRVDLSYNQLASWSAIDILPSTVFGLHHLHMSHNPIYELSKRPDGVLYTTDEVSMLIIARLPGLKSLNYSDITDKDRLNAETFYLSMIGKELTGVPRSKHAAVLTSHPRYERLCTEYGAPLSADVNLKDSVPNSIGSRLLRLRLRCSSEVRPRNSDREKTPQDASKLTAELPSSFTLYSVYSHVARLLNYSPSKLRLVWETGEKDPPSRGINVQHTIEEWDSEDEDEQHNWIDREEELPLGPRLLGTVIQGSEATIRVEVT